MPATNLLLASKFVVVESPPSTQNIAGVPTAICAFVGLATRGPIATPQFHTNFASWVQTFGSYNANSNLAMAVEGAFRNGASAVWTSRTCHFTDPTNAATATAASGSMTLLDRGVTAAKATITSNTGPFSLQPNQVLECKFDGGSANSVTFTATAASVSTSAATYVLSNGMTLVYKTQLPGSATYTPLKTITFATADFVSIGAATAQEVERVLNRDGIGISALIVSTHVNIRTDKKGSGAALVLDASSTSLTALGLTAGTTNGTGNVADIDAVQASEIASLLTALPLSGVGATATAASGRLTLMGITVGGAGSVQITTNTTALGIFTGSLPITVNGTNSAALNTLSVTALDPGNWITSYQVTVSAATSGDSTQFNLAITETASGAGEIWPNLSMTTTDARYVEDFVNANSNLVVIEDLADAATPPGNMPALGTFTSWSGQNDGLASLADSDFTGNAAGKTGLNAFDLIDNITILVSPDRQTSAMHNAMATYCEVTRQRACFAILDPPLGLTGQGVVTYKNVTAGLAEITECAELHWPQIKITNPNPTVFGSAATITLPPGGHLAGVFSRADASKPGGVYEAPAGLLNSYGVIYGAIGLETDQVNDEAIRDVVASARINPICRIDGSPVHLDGHYTLKDTGDFPSIPERRGASFIETSLKKGSTFAKHRNNDRRLRMEVQRTYEAFLLRQYANGAFRGNTPKESFYVDASDLLNPEESVFAGQLNVKVGIATQKPLQWGVIDITQDTRALDERLAQITASTGTNTGA